ncbi:unnamed protein product [Enterobius vermicularis]|uniref:Thioredoxin domain-containing protein n=1 Tax=Enterobius vermicularis TaxID=51028 RepID=A0A0N4VKX1_ENTVE|nr:unnamed protein product [Enterobius vermicularis]
MRKCYYLLQKKAFIVEFYSSWCGACIAYAPLYKLFAANVTIFFRRLQTWSPILQVTAVNCAEEINSKLCREHGIEAFPTLKYFKYSSTNKDDGKFFKGDSHDIVRLPLEVANLVHEDWSKQQPSEWPNFDFANDDASLAQLWQQVRNPDYIEMVVGSHPAKLAWAEMVNHASDGRIRVVSVTADNVEARRLGTSPSNLPKVYLFKRNDPTPVFISGDNAIYHEVSERIFTNLGSLPQVQIVDIMSAMHHMLKEEIPRKQHIEGERLKALKLWIHMLKKYVPGTTSIRRLFYRLDEWLKTQDQGISSEQWVDKVDLIQLRIEASGGLGNTLKNLKDPKLRLFSLLLEYATKKPSVFCKIPPLGRGLEKLQIG